MLEHERLPFVSYPYEWSFEMLRDAALLQLDLVLAGARRRHEPEGRVGLQRPVEGRRAGLRGHRVLLQTGAREPWVGYRQFCQMFLYPLLLQAYRDVPFQPWMRGNIDGMDAEVCLRLLSARDYFRKGVLAHVYLQAKAQAAYNSTTRNVEGRPQRSRLRQPHHQSQRRRACARSSPAFSGSRSSRRGPTT